MLAESFIYSKKLAKKRTGQQKEGGYQDDEYCVKKKIPAYRQKCCVCGTHLRVSFRAKVDALGLQLYTQLVRVVDGAVVHECDAVVEVHVRVRVFVGLTTCGKKKKRNRCIFHVRTSKKRKTNNARKRQ